MPTPPSTLQRRLAAQRPGRPTAIASAIAIALAAAGLGAPPPDTDTAAHGMARAEQPRLHAPHAQAFDDDRAPQHMNRGGRP